VRSPRWLVALLLFAAAGLVLAAAWDLGASAQDRQPLFPRAVLPALGVAVALGTIGALLRPLAREEEAAADLRSLLRWLVGLRWIAVAAVTGCVALASHVLGLVGHAIPLYAIACGLGVTNLAFRAWIDRATPPRTQGLTQILSDLVVLTALLVLSGGVENPFAAFYVFHVILASILLPARDAYAVATVSFLLYGGMALADHFSLLAFLGPGPTEAALGRPIHLAGARSALAGLLVGFGATVFVAAYLTSSISERLRARQAELVQAGKMIGVGELASGIAHEINNPLASVAASAELLEELIARKELDRFPKHVARIREQVERCKEIVRSLLNFARHGDDEVGELDVPFVIEDTLRLIRQAALAQGKEIRVEVEEALPRVRMNGPHLQQVILNLLTNALDAIPGEGRIDVLARAEGNALRIDVRDTGCGIPEADLSRIFDPFFTTKPPGKGTGLGLALCVRLLERAGGTIQVESRVGQGSTFTVRLPAVRSVRVTA